MKTAGIIILIAGIIMLALGIIMSLTVGTYLVSVCIFSSIIINSIGIVLINTAKKK